MASKDPWAQPQPMLFTPQLEPQQPQGYEISSQRLPDLICSRVSPCSSPPNLGGFGEVRVTSLISSLQWWLAVALGSPQPECERHSSKTSFPLLFEVSPRPGSSATCQRQGPTTSSFSSPQDNIIGRSSTSRCPADGSCKRCAS